MAEGAEMKTIKIYFKQVSKLIYAKEQRTES